MGEAKRKVLAHRRKTIALDTFGGRIHVEWDQGELAFIVGEVPTLRYEYAVLVTSTQYEILTLAQLYRDRADAENNFDELKNQWGWGGFTTQDLARCRLMARMVALVYNLDAVRTAGSAAQALRSHFQPTALAAWGRHANAARWTEAPDQSYGSRRVVAALASQGLQVGRYKVRRLMRQERLKPVWKRKFVPTTDSRHGLSVAPNVAYASDITYIRTGAGWLYLAVVLDLFSRKVVGWAMAPSMPASLVCDALRIAIQQRRPPPGLIVHSDRGSQYASDQYQALLAEHGFVCSMSRKGNCWDNAVTERFFLNLKMERVWQRNYANHAEAKCDIAAYIVEFYNTQRLHSVLGNLPPSVYERNMAAKEPIVVSEIT